VDHIVLSNIKQRIRLNNTFSEWKQVINGIPQGSLLGLLLFLIFINDIHEIVIWALIHIYMLTILNYLDMYHERMIQLHCN